MWEKGRAGTEGAETGWEPPIAWLFMSASFMGRVRRREEPAPEPRGVLLTMLDGGRPVCGDPNPDRVLFDPREGICEFLAVGLGELDEGVSAVGL